MKAIDRALEHPPANPAVGTTSDLDGLARRSVSPLDVWAQSVGAVGPSSGALVATVAAAQVAGRGIWLSVLLATGLVLVLSYAFGQFGSRIAGAGSLYTYVAHSFGPRASLATAVALLLGYGSLAVLGLTETSRHLVLGGQVVLDGPSEPALLTTVITVLIGLLLLAFLRRGVHVSTRITLLFEALGIVLLVALVVAAVVRDGFTASAALSLQGASVGSVVTATALMAGALVGFESSASLSAEAARPFAAVPRAMTRTVVLSGVLYLMVVVLGAGGRPAAGEAEDGIWFLLPDASTGLSATTHLVIALGFLPLALAGWTSLSRLVFVLGREGALPRRLGSTHERRRTPDVAIVRTALPVVGGAALLAVLGSYGREVSFDLMSVGLLALFAAYALACAGLPLFLRRIGESTPLTDAVGALGVAVASFMLVTLVATQPRGSEMLDVLGLPLAALGGLLWWSAVRAGARLGKHDQTIASDVWG